jgi:hypothetical protein
LALGLVVCGAGLLVAQDRPKPPDPKGPRTEKIDSKVDRSITGRVEEVRARDGHHGTLTVRTSGPGPDKKGPASPYRYTFRVDEKTRLLNAKGKDLEDGLKHQQLQGAEVRVLFVDRRPGEDEASKPNRPYARTVQLMHPGKPDAKE